MGSWKAELKRKSSFYFSAYKNRQTWCSARCEYENITLSSPVYLSSFIVCFRRNQYCPFSNNFYDDLIFQEAGGEKKGALEENLEKSALKTQQPSSPKPETIGMIHWKSLFAKLRLVLRPCDYRKCLLQVLLLNPLTPEFSDHKNVIAGCYLQDDPCRRNETDRRNKTW